MGPKKAARTISQDAFDELVRENMEELGMDPAEALEDALQTLNLQGVDLSGTRTFHLFPEKVTFLATKDRCFYQNRIRLAGIVTCVPGSGSVGDNPVIQCLDRLKQLDSDSPGLREVVEVFEKLIELCSIEGLGNAAIATRNGGVEVVCSVCSKIRVGCDGDSVLVSGLKAMASLLHGIRDYHHFQ